MHNNRKSDHNANRCIEKWTKQHPIRLHHYYCLKPFEHFQKKPMTLIKVSKGKTLPGSFGVLTDLRLWYHCSLCHQVKWIFFISWATQVADFTHLRVVLWRFRERKQVADWILDNVRPCHCDPECKEGGGVKQIFELTRFCVGEKHSSLSHFSLHLITWYASRNI